MLKERLKGIVIGVTAALVLAVGVPVLASSVTSAIQVTFRNIEVSVDGQALAVQQEPFIFEGRTFLAIADIAEVFGAEVRMNEITNTIEITTRTDAEQASAAVPVPIPAPAAQATPVPVPAESATDRRQRPSDPPITRERAEEIAVEWLRVEEEVTDARRDGGISMDFERGRWVWELEMENRSFEWDFYIDVMTGEVVHVDRDRS